jgi:site-specific DNA-methyltransferase (adenine-specific)
MSTERGSTVALADNPFVRKANGKKPNLFSARIAYESEWATVYEGDARDVLPMFETESFALVVTDPPYGKEFVSNQRVQRFDAMTLDGANDREAVREVLRECVRLVAQNRHLYVFGPDDVLDGLKITKPVSLVWDKTMMSGGDLTGSWGPSHEPIWFAVSRHRHGGMAGGDAIPVRLRKGSVLRVSRPTGRKVRHPSEKPVALLAELIESSSRVGETVLDPFGGSGSTAVAAIVRGRRAVLVEVNPAYVELAIERVKAAEFVAQKVDAA